MYQNWSKIRRHAERLAGQPHGSKHPDVDFFAGRIRKAIHAGKITARREGDNGDFVAQKVAVDSWFRAFVREVGVAGVFTFLVLSPMLLPGGGL